MRRLATKIVKQGAGQKICSLFLFLAAFSLSSCSLFVTRPVQEMSETAAAIRAAKEVQADTLTPELYRQATEYFFKAKREYKFKNFSKSKDYLEKSKSYAERAEFESLRQGAVRTDNGGVNPFSPIDPGAIPPPPEPAATPTPYEYPTPEPTPVYLSPEQNGQPGAAPSPQPTKSP